MLKPEGALENLLVRHCVTSFRHAFSRSSLITVFSKIIEERSVAAAIRNL
jgi:hypothetical protein